MDAPEVVAFLSHVATVEHVARVTQNQALNALSFLHVDVLHVELRDSPRLFMNGLRSERALPLSRVMSASSWVNRQEGMISNSLITPRPRG